jgi:hypothetical protein
MEGERDGSTLPPEVAALAELLLERLDAATGNWRVELYATDGRLRKFSRQEEGGRDTLARFDEGGT